MTDTSATSFTLLAIEKHITSEATASSLRRMRDHLQTQGTYGSTDNAINLMHEYAVGYIAALRDLAQISVPAQIELNDAFNWEWSTALNNARKARNTYSSILA